MSAEVDAARERLKQILGGHWVVIRGRRVTAPQAIEDFLDIKTRQIVRQELAEVVSGLPGFPLVRKETTAEPQLQMMQPNHDIHPLGTCSVRHVRSSYCDRTISPCEPEQTERERIAVLLRDSFADERELEAATGAVAAYVAERVASAVAEERKRGSDLTLRRDGVSPVNLPPKSRTAVGLKPGATITIFGAGDRIIEVVMVGDAERSDINIMSEAFEEEKAR